MEPSNSTSTARGWEEHRTNLWLAFIDSSGALVEDFANLVYPASALTAETRAMGGALPYLLEKSDQFLPSTYQPSIPSQ